MDTSDIRKGLKLMVDDQPYIVIDFEFVKPGKGQAFTRTKLRNLLTGAALERTWRSGEKLDPADLEERDLQYIYPEGGDFIFMDPATGEQLTVAGEQIGADSKWLSDGMSVNVGFFKGQAIVITLPPRVRLQVSSIERTDDSQPVNQATLANGTVIAVPKLVNAGDWIRIDTRTGTYTDQW
jgi:elongation factor P